jgi:hypothetical protein
MGNDAMLRSKVEPKMKGKSAADNVLSALQVRTTEALFNEEGAPSIR